MTTALNPEADRLDGADTTIDTLRHQIDALDAAIINLISERVQVSRLIQTARINSGGTRVELGREREILDTYKNGLGRQGTHLADAVLQVCRGER
jgi:chorismate mutase